MLCILFVFGGILVANRHVGEAHEIPVDKTGCVNNGTIFADGSLVPTAEPCLNCKCNGKTLVCSLRICPDMPVPPPRGCVLVQQKNACCSYLSCSKYHLLIGNPNHKIIAYINHYERITLDQMVNENVLQKRSDDSDIDNGEICLQNGTVYKSGSAMSSSSLCSYCFCIGGKQKCVKPRCILAMEGCRPIFVDSTCCPVRYDCSSKTSGIMKSQNHIRRAGNKHYQRIAQRLQRGRGCVANSQSYLEGQKIPSDPSRPCDICFCIRGAVNCVPKRCAPALHNCLPVVPKGQCCPSSYDCEYKNDSDRAYLSRQFDLFSLLFGSDSADNLTQNNFIMDKHDPNADHTTNEKSIFDAIREGLEFIDNNESNVGNVLDNFYNVANISQFNETAVQVSDENSNINSFDVILSDFKTTTMQSVSKSNASSSFVNKSETTTTNYNNLNLLLPKLHSSDAIIEETTPEDNKIFESHLTTKQVSDFDYTTFLKAEHSQEKYFEPEHATEKFSLSTETEQLEESTPRSDVTEDFIVNGFNNGSLRPEEVTEANHSSTSLNNSEIEGLKYDENNFSHTLTTSDTELENATEEHVPSASSHVLFNVVKLSDENNGTIVKEQSDNFLSALFSGLSTIFKEDGNLTECKTKPIINTKSGNANNTLSIKPDEIALTSKFENSSDKEHKTKGIDRKFNNTLEIISMQNENMYGINNTTTQISTGKPVIIKTHPSILDVDLNLDYNEPTLPPSLPNLKIIPFLPTDAVKNNRLKPVGDYYKIKPVNFELRTAKPESWKTDKKTVDRYFESDNEKYPSITEKYTPAIYPENYPPYDSYKRFGYDEYDYSDFDSPEDRNHDDYVEQHIQNKYSPTKQYDTVVTNNDNGLSGKIIKPDIPRFDLETPLSGFSPPTKTEGGFLPKNPIRDPNFFYDNFQSIKLVDFTTPPAPLKSDTPPSTLTDKSANPFNNVIRTESPPDLHMLIEDKEKLFANGATKKIFQPSDKIDGTAFVGDIITMRTNENFADGFKTQENNISAERIQNSEYIKTNLEHKANNSFVSKNGEYSTNKNYETPQSQYKKNVQTKFPHQSNEGLGIDENNRTLTKNRTNNKILSTEKLILLTSLHQMKNTENTTGIPENKTKSEKHENLGVLKDALHTIFNIKTEVTTTHQTDSHISFSSINDNNSTGNSFLPEPFYTIPLLSTTTSANLSQKNSDALHNNSLQANLTPFFPNNENKVDIVQGFSHTERYDILPNHSTGPQGLHAMNSDKIIQHQPEGEAHIFTKPHSSSNSKDQAGILKVAGCNIYGRMYRVGRIISELSGPCLEWTSHMVRQRH